MNFSGKITNSVYVYFQGQGVDLNDALESMDLPIEFLKDPTCWIDAQKVEKLLQHIDIWSTTKLSIERPLEKIGHSAKDLKAWGVLDSVLRMISKPQDIFLQPQRFISYFISPAPPIANIQRGENLVAFDLPVSFEEFPLMATYLLAAIEAVPQFMGGQMAEARWKQNRLTISWNQTQSHLLADSELDQRQMAPEVMQSLISTLEKTEQALLDKTLELEKIKSENTVAAQSQVPELEVLKNLKNRSAGYQQHVFKLQDYFIRSQQLITLLVGQDRMNSQIREAMRRVNWEQVQQSFPEVARELLLQIDSEIIENVKIFDSKNFFDKGSTESKSSERIETQPFLNSEIHHGENHKSSSERDSRQSWLSNN